MASFRRQDHGRSTVVAEAPHFIKIILVDTKEIEMLKIPTKFMKIHGNTLSKTLYLKVPNGGVWEVDVVKIDGEVWLQNGWKEFADHYSLKYGSLLVFRYDGNSNFWVLIFDKSASEIDYPLPAEEPHIQILDELKSHKRRRINSNSETETNEKSGGEALQPKNPSFRIIVQPSHIIGCKVTVPPKFAERFLTQKNGNVTLSVSDERTWSAIYVCHMNKKGTFETFLCGWTAFVEDNSVKAGDVCVFELINCRNISFKVVIFRNTDKRSTGDRVRQSRMEPKVEPIEISTDSSDDFKPSQRQEESKVKNNQSMAKDTSIRRRPSSSSCQSNPSFKALMVPSYLRGKTMNAPWGFMKALTWRSAVTVMLKVGDKLWPVNLRSYENQKCCKFSGGVAAFFRENSIQAGDECVFELIDKDGVILNVTILRRCS